MKTRSEKTLDAYIKEHPNTRELSPMFIPVSGTLEKLPVYRLPISRLVYNVTNGRFKAELSAVEKKLGHTFDPLRDDPKLIENLLLTQSEAETQALKDDIKLNGQLDPGIITYDGAVINANRRMAILNELYEATHDEKYQYLRVARLPKGVDEKGLWRIEAKLQFGRDYRLGYGPINELLSIRSGRDRGLSDKQISDALAGRYKDKEVAERLEILKLMDSYLDWLGQSGEYTVIQDKRVVEHFNSLYKNVIVPLKSKGSNDIPKIIQLAFTMTESGNHSHWQIRKLREIALNTEAKRTLFDASWPKRGEKLTSKNVSRGFQAAEDILKAREDRDKPDVLATRALTALKGVDEKHIAISNPSFRGLLNQIAKEVKRLATPKVS